MIERKEFSFSPRPELLPQAFLDKLRAILFDDGYETRWIKLLQPSDSQAQEKLIDLGRASPSEISPVWHHNYRSERVIFPEDRCLLISKNGRTYIFNAWMDICSDEDSEPEYLFNYHFNRVNRETLRVIEDIEDLEPDLRITYWERNWPPFDEQTGTGGLSCDLWIHTESSGVIIGVKRDQEEDELFKKILAIVS